VLIYTYLVPEWARNFLLHPQRPLPDRSAELLQSTDPHACGVRLWHSRTGAARPTLREIRGFPFGITFALGSAPYSLEFPFYRT
jgi:hypothetical protein